MFIRFINHHFADGPELYTKCPSCGHDATFNRIGLQDFIVRFGGKEFWLGQRKCPNPECYGYILYIKEGDKLIATYPPLRINFEKEGIPEKTLNVFEEAITSHANQCFTASAIMIRRTLEEICSERGAQGINLKARIQDLGGKIIIPKELLEGMDELRLLGNDAAHVESQLFDKIDKEEVEVALEFTKEILKAVYQYEHLLSRLRALKKL